MQSRDQSNDPHSVLLVQITKLFFFRSRKLVVEGGGLITALREQIDLHMSFLLQEEKDARPQVGTRGSQPQRWHNPRESVTSSDGELKQVMSGLVDEQKSRTTPNTCGTAHEGNAVSQGAGNALDGQRLDRKYQDMGANGPPDTDAAPKNRPMRY